MGLLEYLEDDDLLEAAGILCFRREEPWSDTPFYYVLVGEALLRAKEDAPTAISELTRDDLFDLLGIHEDTAADRLPIGAEPHRPAVAFDEDGSFRGVWLERNLAHAAPPTAESASGSAEPAFPPLTAPDAPFPDAEPEAEPVYGGGGDEAEPVAANGGGGGHRGDGEPEKDPMFRRTPHIDFSADDPLERGQDFQARVYLDALAARRGETVREVLIADLPDDLETLDFDVMVVASDHFDITGESTKPLVVHREAERSEDVPFDLRVRDDSPLDQPAALSAYFTYHHRPSGRVQRAVDVAGAAAPAPVEDEREPVAPDDLAVDARAIAADVTVQVVGTPANDGKSFRVKLYTTLLPDFRMTEPEKWNFPEKTDVIVSGMMSQFSLSGASAEDRQASLIGAGSVLWEEAAPECFKELFWQLIDDGNPPRTIYIVSAEPYIPWEIMCPNRTRPDGSREEREALGAEIVVGRYAHPGNRSPKQSGAIDDSYILAGTKYIRQPKLKKAADEAKWVAERFAGEIVTPGERVRLDQMLAARPVGLLHVVAHGKSTQGAPQQLVLDDDKIFNALQVRAMKGLVAACEKQAPLVFLNACDVGRAQPSLVGAGGFASEFIRAGARCVIAPLWSVDDTVAHDVAVGFYQAALDDPLRPFADILREIRAKAYAPGGEDTHAAYSFYGDPLTSLGPPQ